MTALPIIISIFSGLLMAIIGRYIFPHAVFRKAVKWLLMAVLFIVTLISYSRIWYNKGASIALHNIKNIQIESPVFRSVNEDSAANLHSADSIASYFKTIKRDNDIKAAHFKEKTQLLLSIVNNVGKSLEDSNSDYVKSMIYAGVITGFFSVLYLIAWYYQKYIKKNPDSSPAENGSNTEEDS